MTQAQRNRIHELREMAGSALETLRVVEQELGQILADDTFEKIGKNLEGVHA